MMTEKECVQNIMRRMQSEFRTFGGDQATDGNPIAAALKDRPLQFAAGVNVRDVAGVMLQEIRKFIFET